MKLRMKNFAPVLAGLLLSGTLLVTTSSAATTVKTEKPMEERVRKELAMLPYFGVFDNLAFRVDGDTVVLLGQVRRPMLKSDAENVVKRLSGVENVVNQIEVLPLSPFDDRIRLAVLQAVYSKAPLTRYGMGAQPSIHIIVRNGNVTLTGVVANQTDRNVAFIAANGVPGVFQVSNDLRVENGAA